MFGVEYGATNGLSESFACGRLRAGVAAIARLGRPDLSTSPPYADQRRHTYGGVAPDQARGLVSAQGRRVSARVLEATGTFVSNIKERVVEGERHTYVIELILEMRRRWGWLRTEDLLLRIDEVAR